MGDFTGIPGSNNSKNISGINGLDLYIPTDLSSEFYYIGDGVTHDVRKLRTASEISEALIAVGKTVKNG